MTTRAAANSGLAAIRLVIVTLFACRWTSGISLKIFLSSRRRAALFAVSTILLVSAPGLGLPQMQASPLLFIPNDRYEGSSFAFGVLPILRQSLSLWAISASYPRSVGV